MLAALNLHTTAAVSSIDAGAQAGLVAVGFESGGVALYAAQQRGGAAGGDAPRVTLSLLFHHQFGGGGPCWVGLDEAEGRLWAAAVTGEVGSVLLEQVGRAGAALETVGRHACEVYAACLNRERGYFVTADAKGDIAVWNGRPDVEQPRRVFNAPTTEKWHVLASAHSHIVAARHNPEVFVFDLAGAAYEVRTLSTSAHHTRQIRSLAVSDAFFVAGYSDGCVQKVRLADVSAQNPFARSSRADALRITVHADGGGGGSGGKLHHPVNSLALLSSSGGAKGRRDTVLSAGPDGFRSTDVTDPNAPGSRRLLEAPCSHVALLASSVVVVSAQHLVLIDNDACVSVPAP